MSEPRRTVLSDMFYCRLSEVDNIIFALNVSQAGKKKVYIMRAVDEEDEDNFPMKYLQQRQGRLQSICLSSIFLFIDNL